MLQQKKIHRIFISSEFKNDSIQCMPDLSRRILNVLRMKDKENIIIFNNKMEEYLSTIYISGKQVTIIINEKLPKKSEKLKGTTLAVSIINMKLMDLIIQKSVELGVTDFYPVYSKRSQYKNVDKKLDHWKKVVIHASEQCGRIKLMDIHMPVAFNDFINNHDSKAKFALHQNGNRFGTEDLCHVDITFFVGPEGGFEDNELSFFEKNGWKFRSIGVNILRTETACISALTLLENYDAISRYSL